MKKTWTLLLLAAASAVMLSACGTSKDADTAVVASSTEDVSRVDIIEEDTVSAADIVGAGTDAAASTEVVDNTEADGDSTVKDGASVKDDAAAAAVDDDAIDWDSIGDADEEEDAGEIELDEEDFDFGDMPGRAE